jgi:putative copper export protein
MLGLLMRWIHIASVTILLGGVVYARYVVYPVLSGQKSLLAAMAERWSGWIYASLAGILVSGIYNYLTKTSYPHGYHMWIGIKFLLVLHILAVMFLMARVKDDAEKRARWMKGVVFSGAVILLISAYLRWLSTHV